MKISNLRAKFKPKGCKGNIHFGKIVFSLLLVCIVVLGGVMPVKASEPLYYYDRYNLKETYNITYETASNKKYIYLKDYIYSTDGEEYQDINLYSDLSIDSNTGELIPGNIKNYYGTKIRNIGSKYEKTGGKIYKIGYFVDSGSKFNDSTFPHYRYWYEFTRSECVPRKIKARGTYDTTITGTITQYPSNGISGNYWYIRKGLVNKTPTITISSPSGNSYFV